MASRGRGRRLLSSNHWSTAAALAGHEVPQTQRFVVHLHLMHHYIESRRELQIFWCKASQRNSIASRLIETCMLRIRGSCYGDRVRRSQLAIVVHSTHDQAAQIKCPIGLHMVPGIVVLGVTSMHHHGMRNGCGGATKIPHQAHTTFVQLQGDVTPLAAGQVNQWRALEVIG